MRLDLRFALPAALAAAAIFVPAGTGSAEPPNQGHCPDGFLGPFPIGVVNERKDTNDNEMLCVKTERMNIVFKDDNCNPNCDKDDLDLLAFLEPEDTYTDDAFE